LNHDWQQSQGEFLQIHQERFSLIGHKVRDLETIVFVARGTLFATSQIAMLCGGCVLERPLDPAATPGPQCSAADAYGTPHPGRHGPARIGSTRFDFSAGIY
jgi:hypothetical protein